MTKVFQFSSKTHGVVKSYDEKTKNEDEKSNDYSWLFNIWSACPDFWPEF